MASLVPGGNAPTPNGELTVSVTYTPISGADIDVSAFQLTGTGKVRGDTDMCFYGQKSVSNGALTLVESSPGRAVFKANLQRLDPAIEKIALTATIYENRAKFSACPSLSLRIEGSAGSEPIDASLATTGMMETALILGEFYIRNGQWKFRVVAQGFAGGLEPLAKNFGIEVAAEPAAPAPAPAPKPAPAPAPAPAPSKINLSKISLDKNQRSISLEKKSDFGEIKINLNWNRGNSKGSLFGLGKAKGIDLDLGCLFELQDDYKGVVQALGNAFGSFRDDPFIELMGDDRTGAVSDGEWLRVNGKHWNEIKRICVFAYIYEGAPNWASTDGVVTIYIPDQPPIEVRMNEEGGRLGMCAVALLENDRGAVKVSREVRFVKDHVVLDKTYGWGLRWSAGSK